MKLWLDDVREPPSDDWLVAKTFTEFKSFIFLLPEWDVISFDHDLFEEHYGHLDNPIPYASFKYKTGYHCLEWYLDTHKKRAEIRIHTMNPAGRKNMERLLKEYNYEKPS